MGFGPVCTSCASSAEPDTQQNQRVFFQKPEKGRCKATDFQDLHKAARPTNNCQGDFVPLFLQHGHQCRVAHAHSGQAVHGHDHVSTLQSSIIVSRGSQDNGFNEERLVGVVLLIATNDTESPASQVASS